MPGPLYNRHILLTRPRRQAQNLAGLIAAAGGRSNLFPTIEIKPVQPSAVLFGSFNRIEQYKYVIFLSRNAVIHTFGHFLSEGYRPDKTRLMAVGAGTATELEKHGLTHIIHGGDMADSESLLMQAELQASSIVGERLLLIRGVGGRALLGTTLTQRGAAIDYAEVYRRYLPVYDKTLLQGLWQDVPIDAAVVTSSDGLKNLIRLTPRQYQGILFNTPLVLMSARTAKLARKLGFCTKLEIVAARNDRGLLLSLIRIFS